MRILTNLSTRHVCVIGSGPAGFYTTQQIVKLRPSWHVDVYEKLPVPFGLVRYGVAPDHPEVKNVINSFRSTLQHKNVRFVGNVDAAKHWRRITDNYHAVVLCHGASSENTLGIRNESLLTSAREFVGWYNGSPDHADLRIPVAKSRKIVILGHGNVSLDIARILLTPHTVLSSTDIAKHALAELSASAIKTVQIVGRRGVLNAAFTIKEFREMVHIQDVGWSVLSDVFDHSLIPGLPRPRRRLTELILSTEKGNNEKVRNWVMSFLRSPVAVDKDSDGLAIKFEMNGLTENGKIVPTGRFETVRCDMAIRSIGYKGTRVFADVPFDERTGVIPNTQGRVSNGVYTSGWAGQGAQGVILSTMNNAFAVARTVCEDLDQVTVTKDGFSSMGLNDTTDFSDFVKIERFEKESGAKVTDISVMMDICKKEN